MSASDRDPHGWPRRLWGVTRRATNLSRRRTSPQPPADYRPYGDRRPYVVAETLAELHGPTGGTVMLPRHPDWSGHAEYDLDRSARLARMYKVVLTEASIVEDLNTCSTPTSSDGSGPPSGCHPSSASAGRTPSPNSPLPAAT